MSLPTMRWDSDPPYLHSFPTRRSSDLVTFVHRRREALLRQARRFAAETDPGRLLDNLPRIDGPGAVADRKSTRLNSSHITISYAVFCLKKKRKDSTNPSYKLNHFANVF